MEGAAPPTSTTDQETSTRKAQWKPAPTIQTVETAPTIETVTTIETVDETAPTIEETETAAPTIEETETAEPTIEDETAPTIEETETAAPTIEDETAPTIETVEEIDEEIDLSSSGGQQGRQIVPAVGHGQMIAPGGQAVALPVSEMLQFMQGGNANIQFQYVTGTQHNHYGAAQPAAPAPAAAADIAAELLPSVEQTVRQTMQEMGESVGQRVEERVGVAIAGSTVKKPPPPASATVGVSQEDKDDVAASLFGTPQRHLNVDDPKDVEEFNVGDIVHTDKDGPGKVVAKTAKGYRIQFDGDGGPKIRYPKTMRKMT